MPRFQARGWGGAALLCALLFSTVAKADFPEALSKFDAGDYAAAHEEFLTLAALGHGNSQYNLGVMALKGQGVTTSKGSGVGWLLAAAQNGYSGLPAEKLTGLKASLSETELREAQQVLDVYGHEALLRTTLPPDDMRCPGLSDGRPVPTTYPLKKFEDAYTGIALVVFTLGADGHLRDPEIRAATSPADAFASVLFEGLLKWQWRPATLDKVPREGRIGIIVRSYPPGAHFTLNAQRLEETRAAAEAGDPDAAYQFGLMHTLDPGQVSVTRSTDFILIAAQAGNPKAAYAVVQRFDRLSFCNKDDDPRRLPWLRYAAAAGEPDAELDLARALLGQSQAPDQIGPITDLLQRAAASDIFRVKKHALAILAASPIEAIRKPDAALKAAQAISGGPIQSDPQMFEAVAAAFAATGDFANAEAQQEIASSKAKALGWNTRLIEERLSAYRNKKPWYGDIFAVPAN